jgi:hypothetical protein
MDRIVYVLVTDAGGVDGCDNTDKGGLEVEASFDEKVLERSSKFHWCHIEKRVIDTRYGKAQAMAKLSPTDKLMLGL